LQLPKTSLSRVLRAFAFGAGALALGLLPMPGKAAEKLAVIGIPADPGHFNPAITTGSHVHAVADSIFNGLVGLDQNLNPVPDLATSWDIVDDGKTVTFHLANAKWQDGEALTSEDVKYTFEQILFKYHARTKAGLGGVVQNIETPDPRTVIFRLKSPHPALLRRLDVTEAPILPKHIFAQTSDPSTSPANLAPVGTGPFKLSQYNKDSEIVLLRNPGYFKPGFPKLDRLVFRVIPDTSTALLAYQQDELDYISEIPGRDVAGLEARGGSTIVTTSSSPGGGNCIMTVSFNLEREATRNLALRQAFARAVDRKRIVEQVLFDQGKVATAPISSAIGWAHAEGVLDAYAPDPEAAKALLESSGLRPAAAGKRLTLDMVHFPSFNKYAELMKQDLAKVGIDLVSRPLDRETTVDTIFNKRDFDTNLISYCNGVDPEIGVRRMYVSSNIGPIPFSNAAAYRNDEIDALFTKAGSVQGEAARGALYKKAQEILARDLPYWWLVETVSITAYKKSFSGFRPWTGQFAEAAEVKE
jgi:peptide/nickel transport system substrate-binding protein